MSKRATSLRSQVEQVFHLTGALQVHLRILESARVPVEVRINPSPAGLAGGDIEALAFLVLVAAAKSAEEDLRAIMGKVKAINEAKKKVRTSLDKKRGRKTLAAPATGRGSCCQAAKRTGRRSCSAAVLIAPNRVSPYTRASSNERIILRHSAHDHRRDQ